MVLKTAALPRAAGPRLLLLMWETRVKQSSGWALGGFYSSVSPSFHLSIARLGFNAYLRDWRGGKRGEAEVLWLHVDTFSLQLSRITASLLLTNRNQPPHPQPSLCSLSPASRTLTTNSKLVGAKHTYCPVFDLLFTRHLTSTFPYMRRYFLRIKGNLAGWRLWCWDVLPLSGGSEKRCGWISGLLKTICRDKDLQVDCSFTLKSEFKTKKWKKPLKDNVEVWLKDHTSVFTCP